MAQSIKTVEIIRLLVHFGILAEVQMEPVSAIAAALIAGAMAVSQEIGGQVLKDAYGGLKKILEDGYAFVTSKLIDEDPTNDAFKKAVESEIARKPEATEDKSVQALTRQLLDILASLPDADSSHAGIDVKRIKAGRDLIASGSWIRGEEFEGGRDVILTAQGLYGDGRGKA
ncbi:hypothetical protein [Rhizobium leguminosarum]|uniref:hypothetical protein n=1 Tax=Rhizobium leguminosarum TaxID=384 RepID=UPI003F96A336